MEQIFQAAIQTHGNRVRVIIPFDPNQCWGDKERHDVHGTINAIPIRGPLVRDVED